jgi:putative ABC transport system permease protein
MESEMDSELRFHMEAYAEDLIRGGVPRANLVESLVQDLRYGARMMLRAPGFAIVAVIALALGIGANAAVFSVVNAVLLRPLAYKDSDRLVTILHREKNPVAVANYIDWRDQSRSFEAMAAADYWTPNLTGSDPPEHLWGLEVTQNMLPMLGVEPLLGRWFAVGAGQEGAENEVILSYRL